MGPGEGVGDDVGRSLPVGDEAGGLFDVLAGGADGAGDFEFAEDDFGEVDLGFGAFDFA